MKPEKPLKIEEASGILWPSEMPKRKSWLEFPVCGQACKTQKGLAFWFVRRIEGSVCPYCKAYERVYGRKAHEPARDDASGSLLSR
jgi:Zn ribbon nucleic-acid-binding protein